MSFEMSLIKIDDEVVDAKNLPVNYSELYKSPENADEVYRSVRSDIWRRLDLKRICKERFIGLKSIPTSMPVELERVKETNEENTNLQECGIQVTKGCYSLLVSSGNCKPIRRNGSRNVSMKTTGPAIGCHWEKFSKSIGGPKHKDWLNKRTAIN